MVARTLSKVITVGSGALLGATAGNLIVHLLRAREQARQVKVGMLPDEEVIAARWVPESSVAAALLALRLSERPARLAFLLALAITLVGIPLSDRSISAE